MIDDDHSYQPDCAASAGSVLDEHMAVCSLSYIAFAQCGRSRDLTRHIVAGDATVDAATALRLEKALGIGAAVWLGIEGDYHLHLDRVAEAKGGRCAKN